MPRKKNKVKPADLGQVERKTPPTLEKMALNQARLEALLQQAQDQARAQAAQAPLTVTPPTVDPSIIPTPVEVARPAKVDEVVKRRLVSDLLGELAKRRAEALVLYEPMPVQQAFHDSLHPERLIRGSNRAGKTLSAAVEIARAVTGQDPLKRYPLTDGRCFIVGKDLRHCGQVIYRKLFRSRAFRMIRDQQTGLWRSYRPWDKADYAREAESKPAPPLIPPRLVKEIAWHDKKNEQPSLVRLHNGWEIMFFSSEGKPPQGVDVDICWFDEEIVDTSWYPEMAMRLVDRAGRFIWSATPEAATDHLLDLHGRCEKDAMRPVAEQICKEFVITIDDNPHIPQREKEKIAEKLSDEEYQVKYLGEFAAHYLRVYPEYSDYRHGYRKLVGERVETWFEIPNDWTKYMIVDPGRQVCAVLFAAIPPKGTEHGEAVFFYDELYIKNCAAEVFGREVARKATGQTFYQFIIDPAAGKTEVGSGMSIETQYSAALKTNGVSSQTTGHGFAWASNEINAGVEALRSWLFVRSDGMPKLRVFLDKMHNFREEMKRYLYKRNPDKSVSNKPIDKWNHILDTARYFAMAQPIWHAPVQKKKRENYALQAMKKKAQMRRQREGLGGAVRLGSGG